MKKFRSMLSILCVCALLTVCLPVMTFSASASVSVAAAGSSNLKYHYFNTSDITYDAAGMTITEADGNSFLMSIPAGGTVATSYSMAYLTLPYETWSQMPYLHYDLADSSTANLNVWVYAGENTGEDGLLDPFSNATPAQYAGVNTLDFSSYVNTLAGQPLRVEFYVITGASGQTLCVNGLYASSSSTPFAEPTPVSEVLHLLDIKSSILAAASYTKLDNFGTKFTPGTDGYAYFAIPQSVATQYPYFYYKLKSVPSAAPIYYNIGDVWLGDMTTLDYDDTDLHCVDLRTLPAYTNGTYDVAFIFWYTVPVEMEVSVLSSNNNFVYQSASSGDTHEVTFNSNGGSYVGTQKVPNGATADTVTAPTRDNHTFRGWFTDAACTKAYDFNNAVSGDMTLYAGWTIQSGISSAYAQVLKNTNLNSEKSNIRFVATIPTRNYLSEVGFVFSLSNPNPTVDGANCLKIGTNTVYSSIVADGSKVTATQLGGVYVVACSVENIPNANFDTPIYVTSYAKNSMTGEYTYGATRAHRVINWLSSNVKDHAAAGDGVTDDAQAFLKAFAAVGNDGKVTVPAGIYAIKTNITVPADVTLVMERGAKFEVTEGVTLTINGRIDAGMYQIFGGAGTVAGSIQGEGYAQWFGATFGASGDCTAALQKAVNVLSHLILPYGNGINFSDAASSYYRFSTIYINKPIVIEGRGSLRTNVTNSNGAYHGFVINSSDVTIKNLYSWGNGNANSQAAMYFFNTAAQNLNNIRIENCFAYLAGHMISDANSSYSVTNATLKGLFANFSYNTGIYLTDFSTGIVLDEIVADWPVSGSNATGIHVENCQGMTATDLDAAMGHTTAGNPGQKNDGIVFRNCSNITINRAMVDAVGGTPFKFLSCTNINAKNLVPSIFDGVGIMMDGVTNSTFSIVKVNGTVSASGGMHMRLCSNVRLNNVCVQESPQGGLYLENCNNNIISNLYTTGNSYGAREDMVYSYSNVFLGVSGQSVTVGPTSTVVGKA